MLPCTTLLASDPTKATLVVALRGTVSVFAALFFSIVVLFSISTSLIIGFEWGHVPLPSLASFSLLRSASSSLLAAVVRMASSQKCVLVGEKFTNVQMKGKVGGRGCSVVLIIVMKGRGRLERKKKRGSRAASASQRRRGRGDGGQG